MHLFTRNINTAFHELVSLFDNDDYAINGELTVGVVRNETRNGSVLRIDEPVMVTYERPRERVLFNESRDANPFFHVYEALWMLAGRNDVAPLAYYASNMANYSDDGKTLNGAYGYRWRHARPFGYKDHPTKYAAVVPTHHDQLDILVNHLKADPTSRRAVLQMWNVEDDLLKIGSSKDVCCNINVIFSIRDTDEYDQAQDARPPQYVLDMTVTNRSNDMIWGMLGANYVHFSFLQEYMAARLGVEVGRYHHFTNNLHVYGSNWKPKEWLEAENVGDGYSLHRSAVGLGPIKPFPLVKDSAAFEKELPEFVEDNSGKLKDLEDRWTEPFLSTVAGPLLLAFACHKERAYHDAFTAVDMIAADDWRIAARGWIERRYKNWEGKK